MVAYGYQREFTYDQLILNTFRRCFFVFEKKSDSFKWSNSLKCQLLLIGHYFVESWGDKSTYLFPFWLSVSLILPTTSCIVYQSLHCCSVIHSIVNRTLHSLAMQSNAIIWEFYAVTFAYEGAIAKPESPKKHPMWAAHPRTHLSTKYPPPRAKHKHGLVVVV